MMNKDETCRYNNCGHQLGPWQPSGVKVDGCYDIQERTCERCGGQQTQFRSVQLDEVAPDLFKLLKEEESK